MLGEYYVEPKKLICLASCPIPSVAGKTFVGWCDADGNMIDAVTSYDFFKKLDDAQTIEDRDWTQPIPCKVFACWSDGSGGALKPMPTPTPSPKPTKKYVNDDSVDAGGWGNASASDDYTSPVYRGISKEPCSTSA